MTTSRVILLMVMACSLAACANRLQQLREAGFDVENGKQTGAIELKVHGNGSSLKIENNPNRECDKLTGKDKFKRGCFDVAEGEQGEFTFAFKQKSDAEDYYFAEFQLCAWPGGDEAPERGTCGLTVKQRRDFSVEFADAIIVPGSNGKANLTAGGARPDGFTLWTSNLVAQVYFYWVDVCPKAASPGDSSCLTVDPGSRNSGVRN